MKYSIRNVDLFDLTKGAVRLVVGGVVATFGVTWIMRGAFEVASGIGFGKVL